MPGKSYALTKNKSLSLGKLHFEWLAQCKVVLQGSERKRHLPVEGLNPLAIKFNTTFPINGCNWRNLNWYRLLSGIIGNNSSYLSGNRKISIGLSQVLTVTANLTSNKNKNGEYTSFIAS